MDNAKWTRHFAVNFYSDTMETPDDNLYHVLLSVLDGEFVNVTSKSCKLKTYLIDDNLKQRILFS